MDFCFSNDTATPDITRVRVRSSKNAVKIVGPFAANARTLPNYTSFRETDAGDFLADVSDPAIWSPDHPVFYRVQFDDDSIAIVGVRKVEVCGASLFVDGRRTVLRATRFPISPAHVDLKLSLFVSCDMLAEPTLKSATELGIPVILDATERTDALTALSSWPCVTAIVLPIASETPDMSDNPLRLVRIVDADDLLPDWAHGAIVPTRVISAFAQRCSTIPLILAEDPLQDSVAPTDPAGIRRACEQLQYKLAPQFDLAGYIV